MFGYLVLIILAFTLAAYFVGSRAGRSFAGAVGAGERAHSMPAYHGAFVAVWVGVPTLVLTLLWVALQQPIIDRLIMSTLPEALTQGATTSQLSLLLSEIKNVAAGQIFGEPSADIRAAAETYDRWQGIARWAMLASGVCLMIVALLVTRSRLSLRFRARTQVERFVTGVIIFCSVVAILTTVGIIVSLVCESLEFFRLVPLHEFLFELRWEPQMAIREDQVAGAGCLRRPAGVPGHVVDRNDRDDRCRSDWPVHRNLPRRICRRAPAQGGEAGTGDPRGHPQRRLRLLRRAHRRPGRSLRRQRDRYRHVPQQRAYRRRCDGDHDHPLHLLPRGRRPPCRTADHAATARWRWEQRALRP